VGSRRGGVGVAETVVDVEGGEVEGVLIKIYFSMFLCRHSLLTCGSGSGSLTLLQVIWFVQHTSF
jgi:hypothetical protein